MKRKILAFLACTAMALGSSVAFAQEDPSSNTKINDGINGAPNYNAMAPAGTATQATINDGINGAPNYNATTAAAPKAAKRQTASAKPSSTQQHAHHRKHHTPAS